jgi:hypothetical protein
MSCSQWHELIALQVGGDLDQRRAGRVERHLEVCSACRGLAEELLSDRQSLAGLDARASRDLDLGSIRGAVLAEVANRRRPFGAALTAPRLAVAAAAMVGIIAILSVVLPGGGQPEMIVAQHTPRVPVVEEPLVNQEIESDIPEETTPETSEPGPSTAISVPPLQLALADPTVASGASISPSALAEPMTMKILTDDPDVVIYWIVDSKGEEENA